MPIIYETTADIAENGHLTVDIDGLPFVKGTHFLVRLIPQPAFDRERFQQQMHALIEDCARNNPYCGKSNEEIITELRRQREEMFDE